VCSSDLGDLVAGFSGADAGVHGSFEGASGGRDVRNISWGR